MGTGTQRTHPIRSRAPASPAALPPPAQGLSESAVRVLRGFRLVSSAVKTHFQEVEKKVGIGGAQVWALSVIQANPGIGVNALARAMDVHQTTASNLVKGLVALALVVTERNGRDRRAVHLNTTPAGARVLRRAPGPFAGVLPEALARLDTGTLKRLDEALAILLTELRPAEGAAGIPLAQL